MSESPGMPETDFLSRLIDRTLGHEDVLQPRLPSRFEQAPAASAARVWPVEAAPPEGLVENGQPTRASGEPVGHSRETRAVISESGKMQHNSVPVSPSLTEHRRSGEAVGAQLNQHARTSPARSVASVPPPVDMTMLNPLRLPQVEPSLMPSRQSAKDLSRTHVEPVDHPFPASESQAAMTARPVMTLEPEHASSRMVPQRDRKLEPSEVPRPRDQKAEAYENATQHTAPTASLVPTAPRLVIEPQTTTPHRPGREPIQSNHLETPEPEPAPVINVTIGRIEVRATPAQPAVRLARESQGPWRMSLEEYLKRRGGRS